MKTWQRWHPQPQCYDLHQGRISLGGLCTYLPTLRHRGGKKKKWFKGNWTINKGNYFTNPRVSAKQVGNCWNSLQGQRLQQASFFMFPFHFNSVDRNRVRVLQPGFQGCPSKSWAPSSDQLEPSCQCDPGTAQSGDLSTPDWMIKTI